MNYYDIARIVVSKYSKGRMKPENQQDAIQHVVMKLWEEDVSLELPFKQLHSIATNKFVDYIRLVHGSTRYKTSYTKDHGKEFVAYETNQHETAINDLEDYVVAKLSILSALKPIEQEFVEDMFQGLLLKEIGAKRGYSESRAKQVLDAIRDKLLDKLPDYAKVDV